MSIAAARILVGALLLVLGRRLFWLFVGAVGFVAGVRFADRFLQGQPEQTVIIFSIAVGLISMGLAIVLRKIALAAAGFLAGGYFLFELAAAYPAAFPAEQVSGFPLLAFLAGGVIGALLINFVFNWTLIVLSSLLGASLICESLHVDTQLNTILFAALTIAGVLAQGGIFRRRRAAGG